MHTICYRSVMRNLIKQGKVAKPTPAYELDSWPRDADGELMHPTKGFYKLSRRGHRSNRCVRSRRKKT
jgi:hypothetical protein